MNEKWLCNERFEFLLYINGKIICQRCFNIPNFNEASINSLEIKEVADDCVWLIENDLKEKTNESLWFYYKEFEKQSEEEIDRRGLTSKKDDFVFEIRVDGEAVITSVFSGNNYSPKVRYTIDIKSLIPDIMNRVKNGLSKKKYTKKYLTTDLAFEKYTTLKHWN